MSSDSNKLTFPDAIERAGALASSSTATLEFEHLGPTWRKVQFNTKGADSALVRVREACAW